MAELDLSLVGSFGEPYVVEVERDIIRRFARAIGDPNPIRTDLTAARSAGHADLVASLTFPISLRAPKEPPWLAGLERRRILAGEIGFEHAASLLAGMRLQCQAQLLRVDEKEGRSGRMQLLRQRTTGHLLAADGSPGRHIFTIHRTTVYRAAALATPITPATQEARP